MAEAEQVLGYDDLEPYTRVKFDGREGWVIDKGPHVIGEVEDHEHVYIEYTNPARGKDRFRRMHQNLVDKYLRERRRLWVDWGNRLSDSEIPEDAISN